MLLEDYFDSLDPLDSRVRGARVGIETIPRGYLALGLQPIRRPRDPLSAARFAI